MNDEANLLFLVLKRLGGSAVARATIARWSSRGLIAHIQEHHRTYVEGLLAGILLVASLSLSGSAGFVQQIVGDPVNGIVKSTDQWTDRADMLVSRIQLWHDLVADALMHEQVAQRRASLTCRAHGAPMGNWPGSCTALCAISPRTI